jgi:hypothetical protein
MVNASHDIEADAFRALGDITDEKTRQFAEGLSRAIRSAVSGAVDAVHRLRDEDPSAFAELLRGLEATRT